MSKAKFEDSINFKLGPKNLLITYHPVTLEHATADVQFQNILNVLDELQDTKIIFTKPNADTEGRVIIKMIDDYVYRNSHEAVAFVSLGQLRYLSALIFVDACVGNSSSGLAEVPTFKIGTINIGDRQKGRLKTDSVIDCEPDKESIRVAIRKLYSKEFQAKLKDVKNPYGDGGAAEKIKEALKDADLTDILKKKFYNF
jgi:GDP/UDP-N,N'-diacetylbacillosamine 2-epimerase (hydrolysing)